MYTHQVTKIPSSTLINRTSTEAQNPIKTSLYGVNCSNHSKGRMQQRCIKPEWVDLILEYGLETYQKGKESYSYSLDKKGKQKIQKKYGNTLELSKLRKIYVILSTDSVIVTCAYR